MPLPGHLWRRGPTRQSNIDNDFPHDTHVGGCDVPVDDVTGAKVSDADDELPQNLRDEGLWNGPVLRTTLGERPPRNTHNDEREGARLLRKQSR